MLDDYISPFPTVNNVGNFDISAALRVVQGRQAVHSSLGCHGAWCNQLVACEEASLYWLVHISGQNRCVWLHTCILLSLFLFDDEYSRNDGAVFSRLLLAFGKRVRPCRPVSVGLEMLLRFLICVIASLFGVWIVFKSGFFFSVGESASMFTIRCELQWVAAMPISERTCFQFMLISILFVSIYLN